MSAMEIQPDCGFPYSKMNLEFPVGVKGDGQVAFGRERIHSPNMALASPALQMAADKSISTAASFLASSVSPSRAVATSARSRDISFS